MRGGGGKVRKKLKKVIKGGGDQKIKNNGGQENVKQKKKLENAQERSRILRVRNQKKFIMKLKLLMGENLKFSNIQNLGSRRPQGNLNLRIKNLLYRKVRKIMREAFQNLQEKILQNQGKWRGCLQM